MEPIRSACPPSRQRTIGEPTTRKGAEPQPKHENRDNGADGIKVDAVPAEKYALPRNLIEEGGEAGGCVRNKK
jgi:hypothetical protein